MASTSTKWAEKLLVLSEQADVLLDQAYNVKATLDTADETANQPQILHKQLRSVGEKLIKRFPAPCNPKDLSKGDDDLLRASAAEMAAQLEPYVDCFAAVEEVGREMAKLTNEIANNCAQLMWSLNPGLCAGLLNMLTRYVKLNLLVAGGVVAHDHKEYRKKCRVVLAAHAKAKELCNQHDDRFAATAQYLCDFEDVEKATAKMQEQFKGAAPRLAKCLESLALVLGAGQDWDTLRAKHLFSVQSLMLSETMEELPKDGEAAMYADLAAYGDAVQWVICGFLVIPAELADAGKFGLFRSALHEGTLLPVYRDECLDVHDRVLKFVDKVHRVEKKYGELIKGQKGVSGKFFADARKFGQEDSYALHKKRRLVLKLEMESFVGACDRQTDNCPSRTLVCEPGTSGPMRQSPLTQLFPVCCILDRTHRLLPRDADLGRPEARDHPGGAALRPGRDRLAPAARPGGRLGPRQGEATVLSFKGSDHCLSLCFSAFPCGSTALTEDRCNQKDWPPKACGLTAPQRLEWEREHISDLVAHHDGLSQVCAQ
eukprot:SAG22_NODE_2066_length_3057_cov_2.605139_2_plen_543_part_00